jgi:hypothetical protein
MSLAEDTRASSRRTFGTPLGRGVPGALGGVRGLGEDVVSNRAMARLACVATTAAAPV